MVLAALLPVWAQAQCPRPLQVPVAPIGLAVTVNGGTVGGVFPELLRAMAGGCKFEFPVVPRARLEMMYEGGQADLLVAARRSPRRDLYGRFVPMFMSRPMLVSFESPRPAVRSLAELRQRKELRVAAVRGFDYGPDYLATLEELRVQGRLQLTAEPLSMARMLKADMVDVAIMLPATLSAAMHESPPLRPLMDRLRYEPMAELPWGESGLYVANKSSLDEADRRRLHELLMRMARSGIAWRELQRHHHFDSRLKESVGPN